MRNLLPYSPSPRLHLAALSLGVLLCTAAVLLSTCSTDKAPASGDGGPDIDGGPCQGDCPGCVGDDCEEDLDGDGYTKGEGDCDDDDAAIHPGAGEACDGVDNDCDRETDEGCECMEGEQRQCGVSRGACVEGLQTCQYGIVGSCEGAVDPVDEVCDDALDNDCDGSIDEGCPCEEGEERPCGEEEGACEPGVQYCEAGEWGLCQGDIAPAVESCDDRDNDCDGDVDEGCPCEGRTSRECGRDVGSCEVGVQECAGGRWTPCTGGVLPAAELCDGLDNDCDGQIDDGFPGLGTGCSVGVGVCEREGTYVCAPGGGTLACSAQPGTPYKEHCDGLDNDCDGDVDEDFTDLGAPCEIGIGACRSQGNRVCSTDGLATECGAPVIYPQGELCDGVDNDCDGENDENFPLLGQACTAGEGLCQGQGTYVCSASQGGTECTATAGNPPESPDEVSCDGLDNDCDGLFDEALSQSCSTACGSGLEFCANGGWAGCTAPQPQAELCDDYDNDCDGQEDEDFKPPAGNLGDSCAVGTGLCRSVGYYVCNASGTGTECNATEGQPSGEVCSNGADDDCDGVIDESSCTVRP